MVTICDPCNVISHDERLVLNIHIFRSMCALPIVTVFCSCIVSCFTGMWSGYFLINVEKVPGALVITGMGVSFVHPA